MHERRKGTEEKWECEWKGREGKRLERKIGSEGREWKRRGRNGREGKGREAKQPTR